MEMTTSTDNEEEMPHSQLLSLPEDVLAEVVALLRPNYLLNLRLTSRQVFVADVYRTGLDIILVTHQHKGIPGLPSEAACFIRV